MNLWIARIGGSAFSEPDIKKIDNLAADYKTLSKRDFFQFKTEQIHYVSFTTDREFGKKKYNSSGKDLIAFSGLPVSKTTSFDDYRDVSNLKKYSLDAESARQELDGQFSIIRASENQFECFVDFLGIHKVFYSELPNGELLVSNSVPCMQLFKGVELNFDFYVNWIAFGGLYGYQTEDKNVHALPEFGHLKWTSTHGLKIDTHSNLSSLILPDGTLESYVDNSVTEFKNTIHYLSTFHNTVLPLSGGYDSRLVLEIFSLTDTSNLRCYTYPDNKEDVKFAKKVANYHNVQHEVLEPKNQLNFEEINQTIFYPNDPFLCYSSIFGYQFREQRKKYYSDGLNVLLKGDGGDTPTGFKRYSFSNADHPDRTVDYIVDRSVNSGLLLKDVEETYRKKMKSYYSDKYLELVEKSGATYNFASIYYILERFGNYQSHKLINGYQLNDMFLPYANENFIKAVFSSPVRKLFKNKKESLHHMLHRKLLGNNTKAINFTGGVHWEANKLRRILHRVQKTVKSKMNHKETTYSSVIRDKFFEQNKNHFQEVIHSSGSSELWDYFDIDTIKDGLENDTVNSKQKKAIFRIVPLLKKRFETTQS